jgi:fermentation-respiration switch protein FrsA (DUF1100 family)
MKRPASSFLLVLALSGLALAQSPKPEDFIAKGKTFVDLMAKEDFAAANNLLDPSIQKMLSPARLAETWKSATAQFGAYQKQLGARHESSGQFDIVFVTCQFARTPFDFKFSFRDTGALMAAQLVLTVDPALAHLTLPDTLQETELVVGTDEWALPATLTTPATGGPFPAVVLVHGSGPQDRDETMYSTKPFRDLAWGLASRGVAVLRYVKRTKAYTNRLVSGKISVTLKEETVDDAVAAVALLRKTAGVDPKRIYVLGHSLGGTAIPRIGAADPQIHGFIVLAGTARPLEDIVLEQFTYIVSLDTSTPADKKKAFLDKLAAQVARVKDPKLTKDSPATDLPLRLPADYWLDLRGYRPAEMAKQLKQPMLILQGERDYQATMDDFNLWKAALGDRQNVTFKSYPKMNHLFVEGQGKATPAEYMKPARVSETVIDDIAAWVKQH